MKLISVNVGIPRSVTWKGKTVTTGIFKERVKGRVQVGQLNLEGDRQADLSVHGGPDKTVYAYPREHYSYWREQLGGEAGAGDTLEQFGREQNSPSVADIAGLYSQKRGDRDLLDQATRLEALPGNWRAHFRKRYETTPRWARGEIKRPDLMPSRQRGSEFHLDVPMPPGAESS